MNRYIDTIIEDINKNKQRLANTGTRPLVSLIIERAAQIVKRRGRVDTELEQIVCAICTPDDVLIKMYYKGWKLDSFDRLIVELQNLKT